MVHSANFFLSMMQSVMPSDYFAMLSTCQVTKKHIPVLVVGLSGVKFFCFLGDQWLRNALLGLQVRGMGGGGGGVISP